MTRFSSAPANEQTIDTLLELARCSRHDRYIVAGSRAADLAIGLHHRGYHRVETTASCGLPRGQYEAALIDWRERSIRALETTLSWLVHFLAPSAVLVVWLDGTEKATGRMLQTMLEKSGFVVEAGTRTPCGRGVSACRRDDARMRIAA